MRRGRVADPIAMLARSWMGLAGQHAGKTARLDQHIRTRMERLRHEDAAEWPFTVERLVDQLARAVRWRRWFVATSHCALLAELMHESTTGNTYGMHGAEYARRDALHAPLLLLRNACFHPAMARTEGKEGEASNAPVELLQRFLDADPHEQPLATALRRNPAVILDAPFTAWAIFLLDKAGEWELNPHHGVDPY